MNETNEKLAACPFCNDDMSSFVPVPEGCARGPGELHVCCDCGVMGPGGKTVADAIAAWNRRAASYPASPALHNQIMNLPCKPGRAVQMNGAMLQVYKEGHRDARHAAAELIAATEAGIPASPAPAGAEALARRFHDIYERLAPSFGYSTRLDTREFDPSTPNGRLMLAVCAEIVAAPTSTADAKDAARLTYDEIADAVGDTWPMDKRYDLEEIEERLRSMGAAIASSADEVKP
jgi:hypothetical protein